MITWRPDYQDFQEMFSNENSLKILAILSEENQQYCAADMAKLLDIHVSTAKKYLDLFHRHGFIKKEEYHDRPGKPTFFYPKSNQITITLDLHHIAQSLTENLDEQSLPNPFIRERLDLQPRVEYILDGKGVVKMFTVKKRTKARRFVKQKVELSETEGQFMKYLPHPTMRPEPFLQICRKARLFNYFEIKSIVPFIEKLKKLDMIEVTGS